MPIRIHSVHESFEELKRKRTVQGFLDYAIIAFGPWKKEYWIRATAHPLIETKYATLRYVALIDVFVLLGLVLWALGNRLGFTLFLVSFLVAVLVFVDRRELERRKNMVVRVVKKPVKETLAKAKKPLTQIIKRT